MAKRENLFGSFGLAAQERQAEQQRIEARVTGQAAPEAEAVKVQAGSEKASAKARKAPSNTTPSGRPRKRMNATTMTICISREDKDLVKDYAFRNAMTVSDLIHKWVQTECAGAGQGGEA